MGVLSDWGWGQAGATAPSFGALRISALRNRDPYLGREYCLWTKRGSVAHILSGCSQQDAQEFLKLLMERLHLEINRRGRRAPPILASGPVPSPPRRGGALHEEPELR